MTNNINVNLKLKTQQEEIQMSFILKSLCFSKILSPWNRKRYYMDLYCLKERNCLPTCQKSVSIKVQLFSPMIWTEPFLTCYFCVLQTSGIGCRKRPSQNGWTSIWWRYHTPTPLTENLWINSKHNCIMDRHMRRHVNFAGHKTVSKQHLAYQIIAFLKHLYI